MSDDPDLEGFDQEIRINELREAALEAAGGEMTSWENPDTPPEIAEQFWANVLAYEQAEQTCRFLQLEQDGVELPPPEALSDDQLIAKLGEVIHALAKRNVFLSQTDHWSDRELYERMWHDTLREVTMDLPLDSGLRWTPLVGQFLGLIKVGERPARPFLGLARSPASSHSLSSV